MRAVEAARARPVISTFARARRTSANLRTRNSTALIRRGTSGPTRGWAVRQSSRATSSWNFRCIRGITYKRAAPFSSANPASEMTRLLLLLKRPSRENNADVMFARGAAVKWTDAEDIGIALTEKFPEVDPLTVRFTDLRERVLQLAGF